MGKVSRRIRSIISKRFMPALCSYRVSVYCTVVTAAGMYDHQPEKPRSCRCVVSQIGPKMRLIEAWASEEALALRLCHKHHVPCWPL
ncbi:hypothetical protein M434DRAFT_144986 [Hypoxylon sp. CO27-5]|nr:hypothetical protein M434DRAFT_144986 [Hypoxylon sp. CO27-5]